MSWKRGGLIAAAALAVVLGVAVFWYLIRLHTPAPESDIDLLRLLPAENSTVLFADVAALRRRGALDWITGAKANEDSEYRRFVHESGFDYSRDLDALAAAHRRDEWWFALRARFDWERIAAYMKARGGTCAGHDCRMPVSGERWLSLRQVATDALAAAVSKNENAAKTTQAPIEKRQSFIASRAPVWLVFPQSALAQPQELPIALRIFAISLQSASRVTLSLEPAPREENNAAFLLACDAIFSSQVEAETARDQMIASTRALSVQLGKDRRDADVAALLKAGHFAAKNKHLEANWPVQRAFLASYEQ